MSSLSQNFSKLWQFLWVKVRWNLNFSKGGLTHVEVEPILWLRSKQIMAGIKLFGYSLNTRESRALAWLPHTLSPLFKSWNLAQFLRFLPDFLHVSSNSKYLQLMYCKNNSFHDFQGGGVSDTPPPGVGRNWHPLGNRVNLFITCSLLIQNLFTLCVTCSWVVNDLFTTCLCLAHNLFMHNLFTLCLWLCLNINRRLKPSFNTTSPTNYT